MQHHGPSLRAMMRSVSMVLGMQQHVHHIGAGIMVQQSSLTPQGRISNDMVLASTHRQQRLSLFLPLEAAGSTAILSNSMAANSMLSGDTLQGRSTPTLNATGLTMARR